MRAHLAVTADFALYTCGCYSSHVAVLRVSSTLLVFCCSGKLCILYRLTGQLPLLGILCKGGAG
jgi:hypothetical protein